MQINIKFNGLEKVQKQLSMLSAGGIEVAAAKALNDAAFEVKRTMRSEMDAVFDRVTPYVRNSVFIAMATPDKLRANIFPTPSKKGIDPQKILAAQEAGGPRHNKRVEAALTRVGILPRGMQTAIPRTPFPGSDDGRGNFRGAFVTQLISYFQAFGEQGYRANMTAKRKKKLADIGVTANGYKTINGFVYFVSYGKLRSGQHLDPGIWAKTGIHGSNVRPVMMFTKAGNYQPRFSMARVAQRADVDNHLSKRMRYRIRQAAEALGGAV